jgi:hypothetical protein
MVNFLGEKWGQSPIQPLLISSLCGHSRIGKFNPIATKYGPNPLDSKAILQVMRPDLEKPYPAQDVNALKAIAAAGGGKYNHIVETGERMKTEAGCKDGG